MSTQTLAPPAGLRDRHNEPAEIGSKSGKARAGMAMSIATFAMAAASAIQAVLYLGHFGTNARTDGFFVAFALYSTFGVFSQSLRLTSVGLLVQPGARLSVREFAATLGFVALPVLLLTVPLAGPLSHAIAPGLHAGGRDVTATALPVLGCAMVLQLWAAGAATVLAIRSAFTTIAGAYMAGAGAGLVSFLALMGSAGVQTLGWSMLTMALVTSGWMGVGVRRSGGLGERGGSFSPAALARHGSLLLGRTVIYLAFNVLFVITLAFASRSAAGATTVLSYAYLFASYLVAGTGMALGMSSIPDMTREARAERLAVVAGTVPRGFRYAMLIVAPALAGLIAAGAPLVHAVLPNSLSSAQVGTLQTFTALLVPWTVAALLVNFLLPLMLALGRARLLGVLAPALLVLHVAASALGYEIAGVDGVVGAFFIAPTCLAAVLLVAGLGRARAGSLVRELALDATRFLGLAAVAFGTGWAIGDTLPGDFAQAAVAAMVGCGIYAAGLLVVARPQLEVLRGAVAARPAPA